MGLAYLLKSGLNQVGWKHVAMGDNIQNTSIANYCTSLLNEPVLYRHFKYTVQVSLIGFPHSLRRCSGNYRETLLHQMELFSAAMSDDDVGKKGLFIPGCALNTLESLKSLFVFLVLAVCFLTTSWDRRTLSTHIYNIYLLLQYKTISQVDLKHQRKLL